MSSTPAEPGKDPQASHALTEAVARFFGAPRFTASLTLAIVGVTFATHLLRSTIGWPGLIAMIVGLVTFAALSLWARRDTLEWHGVLPISILVFVGWCVLSLVWSEYSVVTLRGTAYQIAFGFLAIYVALVRDSIQIVRAVGDVLRVLLGASIAVEVLSLLIDLPIVFLGVQGNIAFLGPLQGVFGTRNALGLVALIAVITFVVEWNSRSVPRSLGIGSVWLAAICLVLTRSPVIMIVAFCIGLAALALVALRRAPAEKRWMLQLGLGATALVTVSSLWATRDTVFGLLSAGAELHVRTALWDEMIRLMPLHPLEGWGWTGIWPTATPYGWLDFTTGRDYSSGLNAYLDVYFQVGLVGAVAFVALVGIAFVRAWILASNKRSLVYVWPALVLVVLIVSSMAESTVLVEYGWFLLLACSVRAAQGLSWRSALARKPEKV